MCHVSIIIPTLNGLHLLKTCLPSVFRQRFRQFEVILVDNGSVDGTAEWVAAHHPEVRQVYFPENRGFSAAVNEGIRQSVGRLIFLLNNDTELDPDCLEHLAAAADAYGDYAAFAPKMIRFDDRNILDGVGDGVLRGGAGYRIGCHEPDGPLWNDPTPVFGPCAGAALYRRSFFETAGWFDEDFFAYLEDVDLNFRAIRLGLRCMSVPAARVYHRGSQTTGSRLNPFTVYHTTVNMVRVVVHNYPASFSRRQWPVIVLHHFGWLALMLAARQFPAYLAGVRAAVWNFPAMMKKRLQWRTRKTISDSLFAERVLHSENAVMDCIQRRRTNQGKGPGWVSHYRKLLLGGGLSHTTKGRYE
jgi:GT2 family glycosyltransferase